MAVESLLDESPESVYTILEGLLQETQETQVETIVQNLRTLHEISTAQKGVCELAKAKRHHANELSRAIWNFAEETDLLKLVEHSCNDAHPRLPEQKTEIWRGRQDNARCLRKIRRCPSWKDFPEIIPEEYKRWGQRKEFGTNLLGKFGQLAESVDFAQALDYFKVHSVDKEGKACRISDSTLSGAIAYYAAARSSVPRDSAGVRRLEEPDCSRRTPRVERSKRRFHNHGTASRDSRTEFVDPPGIGKHSKRRRVLLPRSRQASLESSGTDGGGTMSAISDNLETASATHEHGGRDDNGEEDDPSADTDLSSRTTRRGSNPRSPEIGRGFSEAPGPLLFGDESSDGADVQIWSDSASSERQESTVTTPIATVGCPDDQLLRSYFSESREDESYATIFEPTWDADVVVKKAHQLLESKVLEFKKALKECRDLHTKVQDEEKQIAELQSELSELRPKLIEDRERRSRFISSNQDLSISWIINAISPFEEMELEKKITDKETKLVDLQKAVLESATTHEDKASALAAMLAKCNEVELREVASMTVNFVSLISTCQREVGDQLRAAEMNFVV